MTRLMSIEHMTDIIWSICNVLRIHQRSSPFFIFFMQLIFPEKNSAQLFNGIVIVFLDIEILIGQMLKKFDGHCIY